MPSKARIKIVLLFIFTHYAYLRLYKQEYGYLEDCQKDRWQQAEFALEEHEPANSGM